MALLIGAAVIGGAYLLSSSEPSHCIASNDTYILASLLCKASASAVAETTMTQYVHTNMENKHMRGMFVNLCQGNRVSVTGKLGSSSTISQTVNQDQNISATLKQVASSTQKGNSNGQDTEANNHTRINISAAAESSLTSRSTCSATQDARFNMVNTDVSATFTVSAVQANDITLNLLAECMHNIAQDTLQKQGLVVDVTQDSSAYQEGSTTGGFLTQIFMNVLLGLVTVVVLFAAIASIKYLQIVLLAGIGVGYIVCAGFSYIKFFGSVAGIALDNRRSESVYDCQRNRYDCDLSRRRFKPSRHVLFMKPWKDPSSFTTESSGQPPLSGYTPIAAMVDVPWNRIDACLTYAHVNRQTLKNNYRHTSTASDKWLQVYEQYKTFDKRKIVLDSQEEQKPLAAVWYRKGQTYEKHILGTTCNWTTDDQKVQAKNFYKLQTTLPFKADDDASLGTMVVYELTLPLHIDECDRPDRNEASELMEMGAELVPAVRIGPPLSTGGRMPIDDDTDQPFRRIPYPMSKDAEVTTGTTCEQWVMVADVKGQSLCLGQRLGPDATDPTYSDSAAQRAAGSMSADVAKSIEHVVCPWTDPTRRPTGKYWNPATPDSVPQPADPNKLPDTLQLRPAVASNIPVMTDLSDAVTKTDTIFPEWVFGNPMMHPEYNNNTARMPMDCVANTAMVFHVRDTGAYMPVGRNLKTQPELFESAMGRKEDRCRTDMFIYLVVYGCILFVHLLLTVYKVFGGYFTLGTAMSALTLVAGGVGYFLLLSMYGDKDAFTPPTD